MTKIFVGGSRRLTRMNVNVKAKLEAMIQREYVILVGDANGTDKTVQKHLLDRHYSNVIVFCMANGCRNNLGQWEERRIQVYSGKDGFEYYSVKDAEMAREADYGFMLWDAKSKGTFKNILNLLKSNKRTLVYISPQRDFLVLDTLNDIPNLLQRCDIEDRNLLESKFKLSGVLKPKAIQHEFDIVA